MTFKYGIKDFIFRFGSIIGILVFILLYVYSSTLYPGGSHVNLNSEGFDWVNNYWCNLTSKAGMNGQINKARPFAISGMIILCLSLTSFFIQFARIYIKSKIWSFLVKVCGTMSMLMAALTFTDYHDLMTILSSVFGIVVVVGIIKEIYKSRLVKYKMFGIVCLTLIGMNNYVYYSQVFLTFLPLLQKVTFALVLAWVMGLSVEMNKENDSLDYFK